MNAKPLPNPHLELMMGEFDDVDFDGIDPRDMPLFCPECAAPMELPDCTSCGHLIEVICM